MPINLSAKDTTLLAMICCNPNPTCETIKKALNILEKDAKIIGLHLTHLKESKDPMIVKYANGLLRWAQEMKERYKLYKSKVQ